MSSPGPPTTRVPPTRPTRPLRRPKKRHGFGILVFIAVWIAFGIYSSTHKSHHHTYTKDRSDLDVVPASVTVPAGGPGAVSIRLANNGPDELNHTVTFTLDASSGLTITGAGHVLDNGDDSLFYPDDDCTLRANGRHMTCDPFVDVGVNRAVVWQVPVRVAAGTTPGLTLPLTVTAVGNSLYTDPATANNTQVSYPVQVSAPGRRPTTTPPARPTSHPSSASPSPSPTRSSVPTTTVPTSSHPAPTSTEPHTSAGKRIRNAARDAVGPVTIVAAAVVGLALLIVIALALVARRQRRSPLNYIPPRRDRGH